MGGFLHSLSEGQVYEVLLVTRGNVAPIGIVRRGKSLAFKLFGEKSVEEIIEHPYVSVQATNSAGLIVRLALNLPPEEKLEFEERGEYRWIKGLPGVYGDVKWKMREHSDELGTTQIFEAVLHPRGEIKVFLPPRPLSRADCLLIELAVDFTRLRIARGKTAEKLYRRMLSNYRLYRHLGGEDPLAEKIMEWASELGLTKELEEVE